MSEQIESMEEYKGSAGLARYWDIELNSSMTRKENGEKKVKMLLTVIVQIKKCQVLAEKRI